MRIGTITEACDILGVNREWIFAHDDKIDIRRFGNSLRVDLDTLWTAGEKHE